MNEDKSTPAPLHPALLPAAIQAILFAAGYPVPLDKLASVLGLTKRELHRVIEEMIPTYEGRGIQLILVGQAAQLCTREEHEERIRTVLGIKGGGTLSPSMTEVLAIVAYHQPVTRAFIEQVRGVDSSYAINMLGEKHLIESVGRLEVPGRPMLYATTEDFLRVFGLESLEQLPQTDLPEPLSGSEGGETTDAPAPEPASAEEAAEGSTYEGE